jgi:hypothetical protein
MTQPIEIVLADSAGENRAVRIHLEEEAVEFLVGARTRRMPRFRFAIQMDRPSRQR